MIAAGTAEPSSRGGGPGRPCHHWKCVTVTVTRESWDPGPATARSASELEGHGPPSQALQARGRAPNPDRDFRPGPPQCRPGSPAAGHTPSGHWQESRCMTRGVASDS